MEQSEEQATIAHLREKLKGYEEEQEDYNFSHEIYMGRRVLDEFESFMKSYSRNPIKKQLDEYVINLRMEKDAHAKTRNDLTSRLDEAEVKVAQQALEIGRLLRALEENKEPEPTECRGCGQLYVPGSGGMTCENCGVSI